MAGGERVISLRVRRPLGIRFLFGKGSENHGREEDLECSQEGCRQARSQGQGEGGSRDCDEDRSAEEGRRGKEGRAEEGRRNQSRRNQDQSPQGRGKEGGSTKAKAAKAKAAKAKKAAAPKAAAATASGTSEPGSSS